MLTVKFFSLIREAIGTTELTMERPPNVHSLEGLKQHLAREGGDVWESTLFQPNIVHAINQKVVGSDAPLDDDDEVAFFPPMTGG